MPIYAEYNNQNIVFAVTESAQAPVGNFIVVDSFDVIGWVKNGDTIEPAPVVQQYKTDGITQQEWIKLFEKEERTIYTKAEAYINDMSNNFSFLSGGAIIDDNAIDVGRADATYRDLLRDVIFMFNRSTNPPGISVTSPDVANALALQVLLGLLTQARADVIILGVPL